MTVDRRPPVYERSAKTAGRHSPAIAREASQACQSALVVGCH